VTSGTHPVARFGSSEIIGAGRARITARETLTIGLVGGAVVVGATAPFMSRYGWDRDELYFLSAAHHLALGYVDFPPLIAVLAWIVDRLAPGSLVGLRLVSLASGVATVVLVAFIARELGGGRKAQWIAARAWGLTPYMLGSASIFHPTWRPEHLPQTLVLTVGYRPSDLRPLCASWTVIAHVENRWHLGNEERGQPIAGCTLRRPLGSDWNRLIARDRL
jgi:hypothetical protein